MAFKEIGWEVVNCVHMAQNKSVVGLHEHSDECFGLYGRFINEKSLTHSLVTVMYTKCNVVLDKDNNTGQSSYYHITLIFTVYITLLTACSV
jgi:hypothetical protein